MPSKRKSKAASKNSKSKKQTHESNNPPTLGSKRSTDGPNSKSEMRQTRSKQSLDLTKDNTYGQLQEEHLKAVEREKKYQKNKKMREVAAIMEGPPQPIPIDIFARHSSKRKQKEEEVEEGMDSDRQKDVNAIDMRREDAELEKLLRDYNNEARTSKKYKESILYKPLDLPVYKGGIQLPEHLKWITVFSQKPNESILFQEVGALETEIKRLKELKAIHREYRRFAGLPLGVYAKPCPCCRQWNKKKHICAHDYCDKPCRKQEEGQGKWQKETHIQQQIRHIYLQTMSKLNPNETGALLTADGKEIKLNENGEEVIEGEKEEVKEEAKQEEEEVKQMVDTS